MSGCSYLKNCVQVFVDLKKRKIEQLFKIYVNEFYLQGGNCELHSLLPLF